MKLKISLFGLLCVAGVVFIASLSLPASAAPAPQYTFFPTPTPGPDGRIVYIVQENDSIWRIAAIFNISLDKLYEINKWTDAHTIQPGDEVFLGLGGPAAISPTPGPSPTPAPVTPTPTPEPGWGILCVILYNDTNGSSTREEDEVALPGGAISVVERTGKDSRTAKSDEYDNDSVCNWDYDNGWALATGFVMFEQLPEGEYNVSAAIPDGYNATTVTDRSFKLQAGSINYLDFGAQANAETVAAEPEIITETPDAPRSISPVLLIGGVLFLLGGIGLGVYAFLLRKPG
jgi:LysM repeat protein